MSTFAFRLLLLTAPFFAYRFAASGGNITAFRAALLMVIAGLLLDHYTRTRQGATSETRPAARLLVPLWLFIFYSLFQTSRSHFDSALPTLMVMVEGALTVTALVWYVRSPRQLVGLVSMYAAGAVIPSLIGCYQVYGVVLTNTIPPLPLTGVLAPWLVPLDPDIYGGIHLHMIEGLVFPRVASTLVDANFFGIYIACVLLCVMGRTAGLILGEGQRARVMVNAAAIAIGLIVLLFTMSRSAWLGFAVGALYLAYHATKMHREAARIRVAIVLVAGVSVALVWQVLVLTGFDLPFLALSRAQDLSGGFATRLDLAAGGIEAFTHNPLFGVGRANLIPFTGYPTAHSFYLTRLGEDGLLGVAMILIWLVAIWRGGAATMAADVEPATRWAATGVRSALLALLVANIPYDHLMSTEVNWALIGLATAAGRVVPPTTQRAAEPPDAGAAGRSTA
jgi:hypothetical protein